MSAAAPSEVVADGTSDPAPPRPLWWRRPIAHQAVFAAVVAMLVLTALLLSISIGHYGDQVDAQRRAADRAGAGSGTAALRTARREVTVLLTAGGAAAPTAAAALGGAAPGYRAQLHQMAISLHGVLTQGGAHSTGRVAAAGVVSASASRVVVAVAATAKIENRSGHAANPRTYRLLLTLRLTGSHWLVSDLRFVV